MTGTLTNPTVSRAGWPDAPTMTREEGVFLSLLPPSRVARLCALAAGVGCFLALAVAAPFATVQLPAVPAFVASYESLLVATDLVTALLLFGQFALVASRALLLLACGYLFAALMATIHMLSFPGVFAPSGLLGTGQSTAWLYMFWHSGFPATIIGYALFKGHIVDGTPSTRGIAVAIGCGVLAVCVVVAAFTVLATSGIALLPPIMHGNSYTPAMAMVVRSTWIISLVALLVLLLRRSYSVLDLWLMVVMCAWVSDIALAAVLNAGRFDLGFYLGRVNGLLAASFVLITLLVETLQLYRQLVGTNAFLRDLANRDGLTGIHNRRAIDTHLRDELSRAQRSAQPVSLLMIDVDHFKKFNDTYGHLDGDNCLREVAAIVAHAARRPGDLAARYGGEEFSIVLPGQEGSVAAQVAEMLRKRVMQAAIPHAGSAQGVVTVSIGVAAIQPNRHTTSSDLVGPADRALYDAKSAGRNRVVVDDGAHDRIEALRLADVPMTQASSVR